MKEKYIEERFPRWFLVPGGVTQSVVDNGQAANYYVHSGDAQDVIDEHNRAIDMIQRMADAFEKENPGAFKEFWYGPEQPPETVRVTAEVTDKLKLAMRECESGKYTLNEAWAHLISAARIP